MPTEGLRIVFLGTPEVAVPTLDRLLASRHEVVMVVSQPDRGRGRGRKLSPSPIAAMALAAKLPLLRPQRMADPATVDAIAKAAPEIGVVVAFGQFIPKRIRELPRRGYLINAHASLLPRHRGASPVAQAILDGDPETGISVMRVEKEMDAGPVALMRPLAIGPQENTAELTERLSRLAADAILEALEQIAADTVEWTEQDHARASVAPKLEKRDGLLDWREPAQQLVRRIHALAPRPGAFCFLPQQPDGASPPETLRILRAHEAPAEKSADAAPGTLRLAADPDQPALRIASGRGWLVPLEVQRAGGKVMDAAAFLRGHSLHDGQCFGGAAEAEHD